jgi:hypothetical protein
MNPRSLTLTRNSGQPTGASAPVTPEPDLELKLTAALDANPDLTSNGIGVPLNGCRKWIQSGPMVEAEHRDFYLGLRPSPTVVDNKVVTFRS